MTTQEPDSKQGNYYVTATDAGRVAFLVGPYRDDHAAALAMVDTARRIAPEVDRAAIWYAYGTARVDPDVYDKPGILNQYIEREMSKDLGHLY